MSNIDLNVDVGQTKTLTFNTKDKYNSEDIVFNITAEDKVVEFATLDSTGKVPTSQLPSYVDDVEEYTNRASFPSTGEKGKIYVDTTENDIYRWTGSTYIKISGIIGAQGEKGAQGYQGFQGIKGTDGTNGTRGVQGFQGYTGIQGRQGLQGKNGTNGTNGAAGVQGYQGYQGKSGVDGVQGYQGIKGTDGTNGTRGVQGFQGYTGIQGRQGLQGKNGTNGTNGAAGVQGYQGYQGKSGVDGVQGYQGIKGTDGTNGTRGVQGFQGYTGIQGTRGVQGFQGIKGTDGTRGVQGFQGLQGATGLQGKTGKNGFNFTGCFISSYSLYHVDQNNIGSTYTFNKSDFNISSFDNTNINEGDTILVTYIEENSIGVTEFIEHCYIKITSYIVSENSFTGVVLSWFKIQDGEVGAQGYQGYQGLQGFQGKNGTNGTNGTNGVQGYQGFQGIQGISGALATNHWYLDKANPEVTNNGNSKIIQLDNISDSIFAKLSTLTNGPLNGRNFIVDLADSDGSAMINDLFGDFSKYDVPNHVRYHFYIRNTSKRQSPVKINWNSEFYTNVPHRDGFAPQISLKYGECCKIEFVKFDQTYSWVDVELEDITYNTSTAAASENNEDNAMSQIMNYCDTNKLSYVLDKESNNLSFNMIDVIASLCSKMK